MAYDCFAVDYVRIIFYNEGRNNKEIPLKMEIIMVYSIITSQRVSTVRYIAFHEELLQFIAAKDLLYGGEEHGFSLFGLLTPGGNLVCYVALSGGPNATRNYTSFQDDPEFIMRAARFLLDNYNLIYIGNIHSHPMNLIYPSGDDQQQIINVSSKNNLGTLAQIILTYEKYHEYKNHVHAPKSISKAIKTKFQKIYKPVWQNMNVKFNSYIYPDAQNDRYQLAKIKILNGRNPFMQQLSKTDLAEYVQMEEDNLFPIERILTDSYKVRWWYDQSKIPETLADKFKDISDQNIENITVEITESFLVARYDLGNDQLLILIYNLLPDYSIRKVIIKQGSRETDLTTLVDQSPVKDDVYSIYEFTTKLLKSKDML